MRGAERYHCLGTIVPVPLVLVLKGKCNGSGEVERLAFSVIFRLDEEANELSVDFGRAVIKSVRAMTYQEAQERIDSFRDMKVPEKEVRFIHVMESLSQQEFLCWLIPCMNLRPGGPENRKVSVRSCKARREAETTTSGSGRFVSCIARDKV